MNKIEAAEWLRGRECFVGKHDGVPFAVIEPQFDSIVDDPLFVEVLRALGVDEDNYGYSDEYSECTECGNVIRTSPTHATWKPDFWLNLRDGEILCKECTKENANAYFAWLAEETVESTPQICLLDPKEHGFTKVIDDLEYGYHPGQNDDPKKLIAWANKHNFEIAFDVRQNPFTATFDVWLRGKLTYHVYTEADGTVTDKWARAPINVEQIRKILLVSNSRYSHLRTQFREWPTPEEQMKASLKRASKGE